MTEEVVKPKYERQFFEREQMGHGKHRWLKIDPSKIDIDEMTSPPGGVFTREFNAAFNGPHPETTASLDHIGRPGTLLESSALPEGEWEVADQPRLKDTKIFAVMKHTGTGEIREISAVELGVTADRDTNLYTQTVTKVKGSVNAGKDQRLRLTKLTDETYDDDTQS